MAELITTEGGRAAEGSTDASPVPVAVSSRAAWSTIETKKREV